MNWGHYITIALMAFVTVIICLITISMKQDVSLVASNYYKQEIAYQDQIDKIANFNSMKEPPTLTVNTQNRTIEIAYPISMTSHHTNGDIQLYRPSNARDDRLVKIILNRDGEQQISTKNMQSGLWRVKMNFNMGDKHYYHEQNIVL